MARVSYTAEVKSANSGPSFPKLKLELNERARIVLLEEPDRQYMHQLYEPIIVDGKGVMVTKKRKDESTYETYDEKYVKHFLCIGDDEALEENGVDVRNCPACYASTQLDRFKAPQPRFAMNIIKYGTRPGTTEVTTPFQVSVLAWVFGNEKFSKLRTLALDGWDLKTHDLNLGPCSNEGYQKYDIQISQQAAWLSNDETKQRTAETFKSNKLEDLSPLIAPKLESSVIQSYVDRVRKGWDIVNGTSMSNVQSILASAEVPSLSDGLGALKDSVAGTGEVSYVAPAETPQAPAATPSASAEAPSFDDLLSDLL